MSKYLLDTNYLIYLADKDADPAKRAEVLQDLEQKLTEEETAFVLAPLIRYEVLRGVAWDNPKKLEEILNVIEQFESLDITKAVSDLARDLYRFDVHQHQQNNQKFDAYRNQQNNQQRNFEKRKFDMFHYAVAYVNGIELLSKDTDVEAIKQLHQEMTSAT